MPRKRSGNKAQDITVRRASQNNLKSIDVDVPFGRLTVVCGPSGSGKSSLAFDTLYAEGQRRYVETFSSYARQFLERVSRPSVEWIRHIPPAIAIDQNRPVKTSRSTVGTMSELDDYLRLVFAKAAQLHCRQCGQPVKRDSPDSIFHDLLEKAPGESVLIGFRLSEWASLPRRTLVDLLASRSIRRLHDGKRLVEIGDASEIVGRTIAVVDRVELRPGAWQRITESIEAGLQMGGGVLDVVFEAGERMSFSTGLHCARCDIEHPPATASLFSFNSPAGACPVCRGFGRCISIDPGKVIPDRSLSIRQGAVKPWRTGLAVECQNDLLAFCRAQGVNADRPFEDLPERHQRWVLDGHADFYGVAGFFDWLEKKKYKVHVRVLLSRYRTYSRCEACGGARLRPEALWYRLDGSSISSLQALPISELRNFFGNYSAPESMAAALEAPLQEIRSRLDYMQEVGLGYLTLDRNCRTLSGGEVQRLDLARALGSALTNTLYVLDEPSIGLHFRDVNRLCRALYGLRDRGNTLLVVEHDASVIRAADRIIEMGPGPGLAGGRVVFEGGPDELLRSERSLTAQHLRSRERGCERSGRAPREPAAAHEIVILGAEQHNLKKLDVRIPLGLLVVICGVSGSGKSTLIHDTLYRRASGDEREEPGLCKDILGLDKISEVVSVDQSSVPRTPGTCPASYVKALAPIRTLFARTEEARKRGYQPGHFSFRSAEGRCPLCEGAGFEKVEMQFLSDVYVPCAECGGLRFQDEILQVRYRDKSIADVLDMTVDDALGFFAGEPKIERALDRLQQVGLGYLRIGQPANTLSGGEAQRLKLAGQIEAVERLKPQQSPGRLYLFDEPTIGLHGQDVADLLNLLYRLVDLGHSVVVVEHDLDVIASADWVIELGPEGGQEGGRCVFAGPPERLAVHDSHTGRALRSAPSSVQTDRIAEPKQDGILIQKARQHNLRSIDVHVPRDKMVAITGLSGSGKSSLAFDVLFAEGQRRYLDSVSAYARQYISQLPRPEVDRIQGLPPAVAVEQRTSRGHRRSTVATQSGIYPYLRLLFARAGVQHCPYCGIRVEPQSPGQIRRRLREAHGDARTVLLAPIVRSRKGFHTAAMDWACRKGYRELRVDGRRVEAIAGRRLARHRLHDVEVVVGETRPSKARSEVLRSLVDEALEVGEGSLLALSDRAESMHSTRLACPQCGRSFAALEPRMFSFNSPRGACAECEGLGESSGEKCCVCAGHRLRPESLAVKVGGRGLAELMTMSLDEVEPLLGRLRIPRRLGAVAGPLLAEIQARLRFMSRLGLDYLSMDRAGDTLSGGESQRIRIAAQLGSTLCGVCYVVDEPTIGLHPRDGGRLVEVLAELRDRGNTVVVVEHDEQVIRAADHILDLGPGAGEAGGELVASGTRTEIKRCPGSATGRFLARKRRLQRSRPARRAQGNLRIAGACEHNLKNIHVDLPLGTLVCVTGVSGSGKSSLVADVLFPALLSKLGRNGMSIGKHRHMAGFETIGRAVLVDQSPIGRTARSTVATYLGIFDEIRRWFASLPESRVRGWSPSRFSHNVEGGRCEKCKGQGRIKVEMHFLPDAYVFCEACRGQRYKPETLAVTYRSHSIADVLAMSIQDAVVLFSSQTDIESPLRFCADVGLGYLRLGQTSPTLSGGEAQRLKLARELGRTSRKHTLYILEEPTTGLHPDDISHLLEVLHRLVDAGNTVVVVEHNLDLIAQADFVIDLGPEGGRRGGRVVACGSPEELIQKSEHSHTARYLAEHVGHARSMRRSRKGARR